MSDNEKLWRYMDLTKFLALIINQSIYFNRADNYEDVYERVLTKSDRQKLQQHPSLEILTQRSTTFINCWHQNQYESAAMWKLYGVMNDSIAIETDIKTLSNLLPPRVYLHKVEYIDYQTDSIIDLCFEKTGTLNIHDILA